MFKDYLVLGGSEDKEDSLYGFKNDFKRVLDSGVDLKSIKQIYEQLMNDICFRNGSLVSSRAEKRSNGVKWKIAWKNLQQTRQRSDNTGKIFSMAGPARYACYR